MYAVEVTDHLDRMLRKLQKKDAGQYEAIKKKVVEIQANPHQFKPLRAPLQHLRRVHIHGSFVLLYRVEERRQTVVLVNYDHHDMIYRG